MRSFLPRVTVCALSLSFPVQVQILAQILGSSASFAQTPDCKTITDPATRLTCYDKMNPPIATYPIPLPKPTVRPLSMPKNGEMSGMDSTGGDDAAMVARMNGICRGC